MGLQSFINSAREAWHSFQQELNHTETLPARVLEAYQNNNPEAESLMEELIGAYSMAMSADYERPVDNKILLETVRAALIAVNNRTGGQYSDVIGQLYPDDAGIPKMSNEERHGINRRVVQSADAVWMKHFGMTPK